MASKKSDASVGDVVWANGRPWSLHRDLVWRHPKATGVGPLETAYMDDLTRFDDFTWLVHCGALQPFEVT